MCTIKNYFSSTISCLILLSFACFSLQANTTSQFDDDCKIRTDIEPDEENTFVQAVGISQSTNEEWSEWSNPNGGLIKNGNLSTVSLEADEQTEMLSYNGFYSNIQEGSEIQGVQLRITGSCTNYNILEESTIQFYWDGVAIGSNLAGKSVISSPWKNQISSWNYGYKFTNWDIDWTPEMLSSSKLSVKIQLKNTSDDEFMEVNIDNVELIAHYTELYTLCSHACVVMYNDEVPGANQYLWNLPTGAKFLSIDPESNVVNIDFSACDSGILDLEVGIVIGSDTSYCSRQLFHTICEDAQVGNFAWFDINYNGIQDADEAGLETVELTLFTPYGEAVAGSVTDGNGFYNIDGIDRGYYYLEARKNGFISVPYQVGSDDEVDSDINEAYQTDIFYLAGGDSITSFDFGFYDEGSIAGITWLECIPNGNYNQSDQAAIGITIDLLRNGMIIQSTVTDENGMYIFEELLAGDYTLILQTDEMVSVNSTANSSNVENDFGQNKEVSISLVAGEDKENVDAAINLTSEIELVIFYDENNNGSLDNEETIYDGSMVYLIEDNELVDSAIIANGLVNFNQLVGEDYVFQTNIADDYSINDSGTLEISVNDMGLFITGAKADCFSPNSYQVILGPLGSTIGDYVWFDENADGLQSDNEEGIQKVRITLYSSADVIVDEVETDEKGFYEFTEISSGQYYMIFEYENEDREITSLNVNADQGSNAIVIGDKVMIGPFVSVAGTNYSSFDVGYVDKLGEISDFVWIDTNRDGLQDASEIGLSKVKVTLFTKEGTELQTTETNDKGNYSFTTAVGEYYVSFAHEEYEEFAKYDLTFDSDLNSDVNPELGNRTEVFTLLAEQVRTDIDAGYAPRTGFVGDFVFLDLDENGLQGPDEIGLKNFMVEIYQPDGTLIGSTVTDEVGFYEMEVEVGTYYLKFLKEGFDEPSPNITTDPNKNSDITGNYGDYSTDLFTIEASEVRSDIDAGFFTINTIIGDYVWQDYNANGLQDNSETGQPNMVVNLVRTGAGIVASTTTFNGTNGDRGFYSFSVDQPGEYYVQFVLPDNSYSFTDPNIMDEELDSDVSADNGFGTTETFYLEIGDDRLNIDAGVIGTNSLIGDFVWRDNNNNGLQDPGEEGVNGINVFLYDEFFNFVDVTITMFHQESNQDGYYEFPETVEGNYVLVFDSNEDFATPYVGSNTEIDSDVTSAFVNGSTGVISLDPNTQMFNVDAGLKNPNLAVTATIGDMVWEDLNTNGVFEISEAGKANVYIELIDKNDNVVASTESNSEGIYSFENIPVGEYRIFCELPDDYIFTIIDNAIDDESDSDIHESAYSDYFVVAGGENYDIMDIGLIPTDGIISGTTWIDSDINGMIESDELVLNSTTVRLYTADSELVSETETNEAGDYKFKNLIVGKYYVEFLSHEPFEISTEISNGIDYMVNNSMGEGTSSVYDLSIADGHSKEINAAFNINTTLAAQAIEIDAYKALNDANIIEWSSLTYNLADKFIINRKTVDSQWEAIGYLLADDADRYLYTDYDAKFIDENLAYKVTQVNEDGMQFDSKQKWVMKAENSGLFIFPNPAAEKTFITLEVEDEEVISIDIFTSEGKILASIVKKQLLEKGTHEIEIQLGQLCTGTYVLKFSSDKRNLTEKLIVK